MIDKKIKMILSPEAFRLQKVSFISNQIDPKENQYLKLLMPNNLNLNFFSRNNKCQILTILCAFCCAVI